MAYNIIIGRNKTDRELFGDKGTVYLGKLYVQMGQATSLSNPICMDVTRTHVMMICGKRGSGKCLLGDSLITLADGSTIPIKDLESNSQNVMGLNNELKIVPFKKEDFYKRTVNEILKIKLRSGKEIKLTLEHPLLTIKGWKPAEDLLIGSRIATPRKMEAFGTSKLEDYKIKLLAYLLAEGHIKNHWVLFSNENEFILKDFKDAVFSFESDFKISLHGKSGCYRVSRKNNPHGKKNNPIKDWLKKLGIYGKLSKDKFIPKEIFIIEKNKIKLFLNRLFSCDGSIYYDNGWEIDYSSSSKTLINQVHHLLLRFGVLSRVRTKQTKCNEKWFKTYELVINSINVEKYINEIGFFHPDKAEKSKHCLQEIKKIRRNPNIDTIPKELWETFKPKNWAAIGRAVGYAYPKAMRERIHYAPSRQTLLQIAEFEQNTALIQLATSDIFWDEIISLEKLEGEFEVYDISVPEHHNFVANDIIVHNSYSASVIAEEISRLPSEVKNNITVLFFDTLGVFWTMKYPNAVQSELLEEWELQPEKMDINLFVPEGYFETYQNAGIPADHRFALRTKDLDAGDWCMTFDVKITDPIGILIERALHTLQESGEAYDIADIITTIQNDTKSTQEIKDATENRFSSAQRWGIFSKEGTTIEELMKPGSVNVLDISVYTNISGNWSIKGLIIGLISSKLLRERISARKKEEVEDIQRQRSYFYEEKQLEKPMVWIMIDEAHEFLPKHGKTPATDALVQLLREGRQPGISLVLVTQQPGEIHKDVLTQSDIILSHRLTAKSDIEALNGMMQSYLVTDLQAYLNNLPKLKGASIILDDNSERIYPAGIHPKRSWHGGEAPSAIKLKKVIEF